MESSQLQLLCGASYSQMVEMLIFFTLTILKLVAYNYYFLVRMLCPRNIYGYI